MIRATCKRSCLWKGRYWREGEEYVGGEKPPRHFAIREATMAAPKPAELKPKPKAAKEE